MSISSRITSMEEHVTNAYNGLQGLGADLTNVNKNIENISMVLDDIYDSMPQVSGEGTSLTLDNTRVGKIKSTLKGNTSQTTYSGKNLLPNDTETKTRNGITITKNSDGTYKVNGTATSDVSEAICNNFIPMSGTWRMLGCPSGGSASTYMLSAYVGYWGEGSPNIDTGNGTNITYTGNVKVRFFIKSGTTCNNLIFKPMLTTDTTATIDNFEPYVGGTPSPNPSYPQPVDVVSGDNEIVVCGKNLLENTFQSQTANGITFTRNENGSLSFSGTATQAHSITGRFTKELILKSGVTYTFSLGNKQAGYGVYLQQTGNVNVYYLGVSATNSSLTITPTEDTTITQLAIHFPNGNTVNGTIYPMLEVGSSATTYEPYQGNTYNIDLPEGIELCKIGNYQDYFYKDSDKWYLHKEIGKVVLNGSENWFKHGSIASWFYYDGVTNGYFNNARSDYALCNYFTQNCYSNVVDITNGQFVYGSPNDGTTKRLVIKNTDYTEIADFKTWLSTHNVTLYYVLATPTYNKITYEPLLEQLEAYYHAKSKATQTNIFQENNDLPFEISASALKEWQENTSLNSTLSMVNPLSLGNTLNTQDNDIQPIEVDNIEPLEEEENEES